MDLEIIILSEVSQTEKDKHHMISLLSSVQTLSHVQLFSTTWTVAHQAPLSVEFSRQEYWIGLPFLPPGDLPDPGIEPVSLALAGEFFISEPPGKPHFLPYAT